MQKILRAISSSSSLFFQVVAAHQLRSFCFLMHATNRGFSQKKHKKKYTVMLLHFLKGYSIFPPRFFTCGKPKEGTPSFGYYYCTGLCLACGGQQQHRERNGAIFYLFFSFFGGEEGVGALLREGESWCGQNGAIRVLTEEGLDFHFSLEEVVFCPRPRKIIFIPEEKGKFF